MRAAWVLTASFTIVLGACALRASNVAVEQTPGAASWRDRFDVNKSDLLPTGDNPYLTMQPGRVLTLAKGIDTLTVTISSTFSLPSLPCSVSL